MFPDCVGFVDGGGIVGEAGEDAGDVAVEEVGRLIAGEGEDGSRCVGANAGQVFEVFFCRREGSVVMCDDVLSSGPEHTGTAVIAQALPCF